MDEEMVVDSKQTQQLFPFAVLVAIGVAIGVSTGNLAVGIGAGVAIASAMAAYNRLVKKG
jgi:F0F1-type ATP synthase membrane subunit c/vacuolar-type H+-ATPase subunit K